MRGHAAVGEGARVMGNVEMYGDACVSGTARVRGNVVMRGEAVVTGYAELLGNAEMSGGIVHRGKHAEVYHFGSCDNYSRCLVQIGGVAWVGAGCRWFTLTDAIEHWSNHDKDRATALILLEGAKAIADRKNWSYEESDNG